MFIILFLSVLVHYVPTALALDFDLALDEDQAVAHHHLDGDLAPVNLCSGATGCCGTGKHHHLHFFLTLTAKHWQIF